MYAHPFLKWMQKTFFIASYFENYDPFYLYSMSIFFFLYGHLPCSSHHHFGHLSILLYTYRKKKNVSILQVLEKINLQKITLYFIKKKTNPGDWPFFDEEVMSSLYSLSVLWSRNVNIVCNRKAFTTTFLSL